MRLDKAFHLLDVKVVYSPAITGHDPRSGLRFEIEAMRAADDMTTYKTQMLPHRHATTFCLSSI